MTLYPLGKRLLAQVGLLGLASRIKHSRKLFWLQISYRALIITKGSVQNISHFGLRQVLG